VDEDIFNMSIRKFLKHVGVTSQREIEQAVREAVEAGRVKGSGKLRARMRLTIDEVGLSHDIEGDIALQ